ncbi:MAG: hypothetical protein ACYDCO_09540 [Armatimonadota bacterium]
MRLFIVGMLAVMGVGMLVRPSFAQSTLDTNTKIQIVSLVVTEAEKAMAAGKRDTARFYLLGVTEIADKLKTSLPQDVAMKYNAVATAAWPNQLEHVADFQKNIAEYSPKLRKYGMMMNFMQPHDTMGFDAWARYVIGARQINTEAEACATAFAAKSPGPAVYLSPAGANLGAYALFPSLFNMLLGETFANEYAKSDILPNALAKSDEVLKGISPDEKNITTLELAAGQLHDYIGYIEAIDKTHARLPELKAKEKALIDKAKALYAAQVKSNRLPADAYRGEKGAELRAEMASLYTKKYPKETVLKVVITSNNWSEYAEAWSEGDVIKAGIFRSVEALVAVEREDKRCWVYAVRFCRQWTGTGDTFTDTYLNSMLWRNYEMLKEYIK